MLLEFRTRNYKSFKEEMVFSMTPAPKQKGLDYSILKETVEKKEVKALCSAVIYGPNASGKTNIIGAMDTFKEIVLRGHIRNDSDPGNPNMASGSLELIPNSSDRDGEPVSFFIRFVHQGVLVEYELAMDLGDFLEVSHQRKITKERLVINDKMIFTRGESLEFGILDVIRGYYINSFKEHEESAIALAGMNLNAEELFLVNGFKNLFASKLVSLICDWIENDFVVVYRADAVQIRKLNGDVKEKTIYVEKTVNEVADEFGCNSGALAYINDGDSKETKLYSLFDIQGKRAGVPAEIYESYGTVRFVNMFPLIASTLAHGSTLIVDEFDASIHPMALMNLINIFHNDEINVNHAQLIFNTHNPIFLNGNLYRRDEIKFVERDEETHFSTHYSLSDFGTAGDKGVRKNEDYMKNYFVDRYGAIKNVDFSPIFETLICDHKEG